MDELIRFVGGISWIIGLIMLMVAPLFGLIILGVAILATISSVGRTRAKRHQELLDAARGGTDDATSGR